MPDPATCRRFLPWLVAVSISACSSAPPGVRDQLDPLTGVTVTRASAPIVLYRDTSSRAANARDYVYLGPLEVNRMGQLRYFLWLAAWSTAGRSFDDPVSGGLESIVVFADGEPLLFEAAGWTLDAIGASEPTYSKPVASALEVYYPVTLDQIRMIAAAADVRLQTTTAAAETFELWDSKDPGLAAIRVFTEYR